MKLEEQIKELVKPIIEENGYYLADVLYEIENNNQFLRIIIDKDGFINLEDCVKVTKLINDILDESDLIKESYILDVCSKEKGSM